MVACREQSLLARIPQGECEHSTQMLEQSISVRLIQCDNQFTVAVRNELITARLKLLAQLDIIINFAVTHEQDIPRRIAQWLPAALQVNDRQSSMSECRLAVAIHTLAVGSTMHERLQHRCDVFAVMCKCPDNSGDATHQTTPAVLPAKLGAACSNTLSYSRAQFSIK